MFNTQLFTNKTTSSNAVILSNNLNLSAKAVKEIISSEVEDNISQLWILDTEKSFPCEKNYFSVFEPSVSLDSLRYLNDVDLSLCDEINYERDMAYSKEDILYTDIENEILLLQNKDSDKIKLFELESQGIQKEYDILNILDGFYLKLRTNYERNTTGFLILVIKEDISKYEFSYIVRNRVERIAREARKYNGSVIFISNNENSELTNRLLELSPFSLMIGNMSEKINQLYGEDVIEMIEDRANLAVSISNIITETNIDFYEINRKGFNLME